MELNLPKAPEKKDDALASIGQRVMDENKKFCENFGQAAKVIKPMVESISKPFKAPTFSTMAAVSQDISQIIKDGKDEIRNKEAAAKNKVSNVFKSLDGRDEQQIERQLRGDYIKEFVYEYCQIHEWPEGVRPKECTCHDINLGLSWVGIQEASRAMQITVQPGTAWLWFDGGKKTGEHVDGTPDPGVIVHEFDERIRVMIRAKDSVSGIVRVGIAEQNKRMRVDGQWNDNGVYSQMAVSKAQRNAFRQLLPQVIMKMWIDKFLLEKGIKPVNEGVDLVSEESLKKLEKILKDAETTVEKGRLKDLVATEERARYLIDMCDTDGGFNAFLDFVKPRTGR